METDKKRLDVEAKLAYLVFMNKPTFKNLNQLKAHYGQWKFVAAALGMEARSLRHLRRNMSKPAMYIIRTKAKQLLLCKIIQHLLVSGAISRKQVRQAWVELNKAGEKSTYGKK